VPVDTGDDSMCSEDRPLPSRAVEELRHETGTTRHVRGPETGPQTPSPDNPAAGGAAAKQDNWQET